MRLKEYRGRKYFCSTRSRWLDLQRPHNRLQLQKVSSCCWASGVPSCARLRDRIGGSSSGTSSPAEHTVLLAILQHTAQMYPKEPTTSHRWGEIEGKVAIHSGLLSCFSKTNWSPRCQHSLAAFAQNALGTLTQCNRRMGSGNRTVCKWEKAKGREVEGKFGLVELGIDLSKWHLHIWQTKEIVF